MSTVSMSDLKPMTDGIVPIPVEERHGRLEKARTLMAENHVDAMILEPGSGLFYFTGIRWGRTERMMAAILPVKGEIVYVCPGFEEERLRELIVIGGDVRAWEEHESPYKLVAGIFKDRKAAIARVGIEESVRFFLLDGIRKQAPLVEWVSADPMTIACRAYKSSTEIALIQRAMDITLGAFKVSVSLLREGMSQEEFSANSRSAHKALGVSGEIGCQFGASTAYPHGSTKQEHLKEGDVVLMDGSCTVDGYYSDISRTIVFGRPTQRQKDVWNLEKAAQAAAFAAAQVGTPCGHVDAAARKVITDAGWGPGYKVPGLPHRTGHGIGLDIHEWYPIVQGSQTPLLPGMCFSDEPMIAIYGEFGVRLEDCIYMAEDGPRFFTQPSPSIEQPFA
jgi:Xaa-Pro dipeptidase